MIPDTTTTGASDGGADFEAYTRLLRALLPRLTGVSIFNDSGQAIWSSDMVANTALPKLIAENQQQIAMLEKRSATVNEDEVHIILQAYLTMKRKHLQTLQETFTNVNHTPP